MPTKLRPIDLALIVLVIMALPATHPPSGKATDITASLASHPRPAAQVPELCRGESTREGWWGPMEYKGRMHTLRSSWPSTPRPACLPSHRQA